MLCSFVSLIYIFFDRVPCRSGMCTTPLHVTSSQLIASEIFPVPAVKTLLYPGAVINGIVKNMTVPSWDNLLNIYNLTSVKEASAVTDLQRLEVLFLNWWPPISFCFSALSSIGLNFGESLMFIVGKEAHMLFLWDIEYIFAKHIEAMNKNFHLEWFFNLFFSTLVSGFTIDIGKNFHTIG